MKAIVIALLAIFMLSKCGPAEKKPVAPVKTVDLHWLDSVIQISDTSYHKPYKRPDFVTAYYYINKKDSSVCQVMKDSFDVIRQIILSRHSIRKYFAAFYANGQLEANLPLDSYGQYNGMATYYYINGNIQSTGRYVSGFKNGTWENYNEVGEKVSTEEYDANGQLIKK